MEVGKMKIEIWSDIACPYCYIGKRKLERALAKFPNRDKVKMVWHCYELNPDLPKKPIGKSFYEYFSETYNSTIDQVKENCRNIADLAKSVDLDFHFEKLVVTNTSDALRLEKLAQSKELANEVAEVLFEAYFVKGEDVSNHDTLVRLGTQVGLSETDIRTMLNSKTYLKEIEKDIDYSENGLNLEYIPFYLFNNKHIIQGSVSEEDYLDILTKSYAEWLESGVSKGKPDEMISGQSCSIDGVCS